MAVHESVGLRTLTHTPAHIAQGVLPPCSTSPLLHPLDPFSLWQWPVPPLQRPLLAVTPTPEGRPHPRVSMNRYSEWTLPLQIPRDGRRRARQMYVYLCLCIHRGQSDQLQHSESRLFLMTLHASTTTAPLHGNLNTTHALLHFSISHSVKDMSDILFRNCCLLVQAVLDIVHSAIGGTVSLPWWAFVLVHGSNTHSTIANL